MWTNSKRNVYGALKPGELWLGWKCAMLTISRMQRMQETYANIMTSFDERHWQRSSWIALKFVPKKRTASGRKRGWHRSSMIVSQPGYVRCSAVARHGPMEAAQAAAQADCKLSGHGDRHRLFRNVARVRECGFPSSIDKPFCS